MVSDLELKAITSYFLSALGILGSNDAFGPFPELHSQQALGILQMIQLRYDHAGGIPYNRKLKNTEFVYQSQSVFHNLEMFRRVKQLYLSESVRYALTAAENPQFYKKVREEFPESNTKFALSLSNIFDCGSYNCLTFSNLQETLRRATESLNANAQTPLVVFRTTNDRPPHGFYRYDISDVSTVPQQDEVESRASPRFNLDAAADALSWLLRRVSRQ